MHYTAVALHKIIYLPQTQRCSPPIWEAQEKSAFLRLEELDLASV